MQTLSNKSQQFNITLCSRIVTLKEIIVKAPEVLVKNDTVSYNVESFKSAADRSIEDVIKKLPGVKVTTDGKIAYQGKDISKFNIEGMDVLGGKYTFSLSEYSGKRCQSSGGY